jgi:hypothetical protein
LIAKLIGVLEQTAVWANAHPRESLAILERYTKTSPSVLANMKRCAYGTKLDAKAVQPNIDLAVKYGLLAHSFPASQLLVQP